MSAPFPKGTSIHVDEAVRGRLPADVAGPSTVAIGAVGSVPKSSWLQARSGVGEVRATVEPRMQRPTPPLFSAADRAASAGGLAVRNSSQARGRPRSPQDGKIDSGEAGFFIAG